MGYWKGGGSARVLAHFGFYRVDILMGGGSERILIESIFELMAWGLRWVGGQK